MTNAAAVLEALGDPTRRAILEHLVRLPSSVTDVARDLPVTRSAVSQHLRVLKEAGIVADRAVGTRRIYSVDPEALAAIRDYFDAFWKRSLAAFAEAASTEEDE